MSMECVAVLVVEDEPIIRMDAVSFLEDAGFVALEAPDAQTAIALLSEIPTIKAVLTDIEMPGAMDGVALAHAVAERWPAVSVIVASGRVLPRPDQLPEGAVFIRKPYRPEAIIEAVRKKE